MKKILVVCRFNQARSIVIGALLRENFENIEVVTAGIEAKNLAPIPVSTGAVCKRWNLLDFDRYSKSFESIFLSSDWDAILAADDYVFHKVREIAKNHLVFNLIDYANVQSLIPIDPTNLEPHYFEMELSKASIISMRWAKKFLGFETNNIEGLICSNLEKLPQYIENFKELNHRIFLIDTRLQLPVAEFWKPFNIEIKEFNPRKLPIEIEKSSTSGVQVLVSRYEIDFPETIFVSKKWQLTLDSLSRNGDVKLLSILDKPLKNQEILNPILSLNNSSNISEII